MLQNYELYGTTTTCSSCISRSHVQVHATPYFFTYTSFVLYFKFINGPCADHILIPQGSTRSSRPIFFDIIKAHIFLFANPKFQLQILCSFGNVTKNVKFTGKPEK